MLVPGTEQWQYIKVMSHILPYGTNHAEIPFKPILGYAICNIGDTLAIFSGGILRSNVHRVLYASVPCMKITDDPSE